MKPAEAMKQHFTNTFTLPLIDLLCHARLVWCAMSWCLHSPRCTKLNAYLQIDASTLQKAGQGQGEWPVPHPGGLAILQTNCFMLRKPEISTPTYSTESLWFILFLRFGSFVGFLSNMDNRFCKLSQGLACHCPTSSLRVSLLPVP